MLIYLAGPIDQAGNSDELRKLRQEATDLLLAAGAVVFDPAAAFSVPAGAAPEGFISRIDDYALSQSDGLLALLPDGYPTVGTPIEIGQAVDAHTPTVVVGGHRSWALAGRGLRLCETVESAVNWLMDVVSERPSTNEPDTNSIVIKVAGTGLMPTRAHPGDAGFDLYTSEDTVCAPGEFTNIHTGVHVQVPWGLYIEIHGRSSTAIKRHLQVHEGVIDAGYTGELFVSAHNPGADPVVIQQGERVAQFIVHERLAGRVRLERVDQLQQHVRGHNGLGSSGT